MNKKELKAYYREIEKLLVCGRKEKTAFMAELERNVYEYIDSTGHTDIEKIKAEFGTPEKIAESFLTNSDALTVRKRLSTKKMILAAIIIALAIYLIFVVVSIIDVHTEAHGYMQQGIMLISTNKGGGIL